MATTEQVNSFIITLSKLAQAEFTKRKKSGKKWVLPSVCIAQAALETGWGTSTMMAKANAYFGIKAGTTWKGKVYSSKTKECYDGRTYTTITDCFRAYDSLSESVADYYNLITGSERYSKACNKTNPRTVITAIKNGGYATAPNYIDNVMAIINKYNLTKYDKVTSTTTKTSYYPKYTGKSVSIVDALQSLKIDSNFNYRKKIANANGISNYSGTAVQNTKMLNLLKQGKLKKA